MVVRRRRARGGGGRQRRAVRRPGGKTSRQHAGGDRSEARTECLHHEYGQMPPARQPQPGAGRSGAMRAVPAPPDRAHQAEADRGARQSRGGQSTEARRRRRQHARQAARIPGYPADRNVSSRLSAAQPAREGEGMGGSAFRGGYHGDLEKRSSRHHLIGASFPLRRKQA